MTEFEYLSVLISVIFGLGLTHILTGSVRAIYARRTGELQLVYSAFVLVVLVLNWWVAFGWRDHPHWSFEAFLLMVFWGIANYVMAITLYPPSTSGSGEFDAHRTWFIWAIVVMLLFDIAQTGASGDLFRPWYYLPYVVHYIVLSLVAIKLRAPWVQRAVAWWFLVSVLAWALLVRRFLAAD